MSTPERPAPRGADRELVSRGPVQGELARRLLVQVQQRSERRDPGTAARTK